MAKQIIDARVQQKAQPLAGWEASELETLNGEMLFIRSDTDDAVIGFKLGAKGKKFRDLPYPDLSVRDKATPSTVFSGAPSGVYIPTQNGVYNGVSVDLSEGYQVLYWDGVTLVKVVYDRIVDVINNLNSTSAISALSAYQGRVLDDKKEDKSNKTSTVTPSDTLYPSNNAIIKYLDDFFEKVSNKTQTIDRSTTNYPSNRAVYNYVESKINGATFGGVISPSYDLSTVKIATWFFATKGTYNIPTLGEVILSTDISIIAFDGKGNWTYEELNISIQQDFIVYDNVAQLRGMSEAEKSLITSEVVKGITLLGYYDKGDTPAPINYYLYTGTDVDDGGSVFVVGGIKLRHDFKGIVYVEYFKSIEDSLSYCNKKEGLTLMSSKGVIEVSNTIEMNINNYIVDLSATTLKPSSQFPKNQPIVKISGYQNPSQRKLFKKSIRIDGGDVEGVVGVELRDVKTFGGEFNLNVMNCFTGLDIVGSTERNTINVNGHNCRNLVLNRAGDVSLEDYTPDENVIDITAGYCTTYFHDMPNSGSSYTVNFNCEQSIYKDYQDFAVKLEGSKLGIISGELRANRFGGILINGQNLEVDVTRGIHLIENQGNEAVVINDVRTIIGTINTSFNRAGGLWFKKNQRPCSLKFTATGGDSLQVKLGDREGNTNNVFRYSQLDLCGFSDGSSNFLDINNIEGVSIDATATLNASIIFTNRSLHSNLNLLTNYITSNIKIQRESTVSSFGTKINLKGNVSKAELQSYTYYQGGMEVSTIRDMNYCNAIYDNLSSRWIFVGSTASLTDRGLMLQATPQQNSSATTVEQLVNEFNNLLNRLRVSGHIAT